MAKVVKSKRVNKKAVAPTKRTPTKAKRIAAPKKVVALKAAQQKNAVASPKGKVTAAPQAPSKKTITKKLLETIEKRKAAREAEGGEVKKTNPFGRPPGRRRGRRPKNIEYNPENREDEENYVVEAEYEKLEYDTGIRVKSGGEDSGFVFERSEDFDEELNFDW